MARQYTSQACACLSVKFLGWRVCLARAGTGADRRRTLTLGLNNRNLKNLRKILSFLLTPKLMERSIRLGWSKVVGSGSNLVANDHLVAFPREATR